LSFAIYFAQSGYNSFFRAYYNSSLGYNDPSTTS
jgi:hypothetical protein